MTCQKEKPQGHGSGSRLWLNCAQATVHMPLVQKRHFQFSLNQQVGWDHHEKGQQTLVQWDQAKQKL